MRTNIVETVVGAAVLLTAGVFFYIAYESSSGQLRNGYTLTAKFDRVDGLNVGNDVKVSGVKVGTVEAIHIDPASFNAIVKLVIEPHLKLPTDTSAEVISESFMGGKYIALVPGGDEKPLENKGEIRFTQAAVSWESLIGKFLFSANKEEK